jgi:hypothetical protein
LWAPKAASWFLGTRRITDGRLALIVPAVILLLFPLLPSGHRPEPFNIPR